MYHMGSDGGEFYPFIATNSLPIGYSDGAPFMSANRPVPSFNSKEKILGQTYGYMANRGELRSSQSFDSQEKMYSLGNNWVCLAVANYQKTYHSTDIHADYVKTPTDRDIAAFVENAHKRGVKVCLKPMVNTEDGVWRAHIGFPDLHSGDMDYYWKLWFISYKNFLLHYAELAQELNCEMFCIGCEMIGTEHRKYDWLYLIDEVRRVYRGKIVYNTNHDREDAQDWFDTLDYIATSAYYPVGKNGLNEDAMLREWEKVKWRLNAIADSRKKQYIFMEIGCRSAKNCATEPWDFNTHMEPSLEEQELFYKTCLKTFIDDSHFAGVFWWDWPTYLYSIDTAAQDTSYCIYGKPAEQIVKNYYSKVK